MSGSPMRGYSWPPFEPGNEAALTHGAYSANRVEPIATALRAQLLEVAAWCAAPAFAATVAAWSQAEARARLLQLYLDEVGLLDAEGEPRSALAALDKAERAASRLREQLGLTPAAWAALRRAWSDDDDAVVPGGLAALKQTGRAIREAQARATDADDDEEGDDDDDA